MKAADLTWAGLPYHIWKEGKKISDPVPSTHEREGGESCRQTTLGAVELRPPDSPGFTIAVGIERSRGNRTPDYLGI
jgi:hypothetical protein